jgi:nitrile hydratase
MTTAHEHGPAGRVGDHLYAVPEEDLSARTKALEQLLINRGFLSVDAVDLITATYETEISPLLGSRVVARAWVDPEFKRALLADATAACRSLGIGGLQGEYLVAVENTDDVHNVVVCTLCSCYPWPVLGLPPRWYKAPPYRARIVSNPRRTLREAFGLDVPDSITIKVWDSSSEIRYFVIPQRPAGTDGLSEDELVPLVGRDRMIGVAR